MKTDHKIYRRLFFWIFVWSILLSTLLLKLLSWDPAPAASALYDLFMKSGAGKMTGISWTPEAFRELFFQVSLVLAVFLGGVLLWGFQKASVRRALAGGEPSEEEDTPAEAALPEKRPEEGRKQRERDDRMKSLHLLSLLQREGRLADFLEEDLEGYDDAQIGAAVRDIHNRCRKTLHEHLSLEAVLDGVEGGEVTVPAGFDPDAVKLTGNVSGTPPFKGILQHRGWRVVRLELPAVTGDRNPDIIAPAEVEIP